MTLAATSSEVACPGATLAAVLLAVDPVGLGGAVIATRHGDEAMIDQLRAMLGSDAGCRRVPSHIPDDRLLGGLDLVATMAQGRAVVEPGLLTRADGGFLVLPAADRMARSTAARIASAMDMGAVHLARDGIVAMMPAHFGLVAVDTSDGSGSGCPECLKDRLAFWQLDETSATLAVRAPLSVADCQAARKRLGQIAAPQDIVDALVTAAADLGIASLRAPMLALKVARAHAALEGRAAITAEDAAVAARLVLGPRATQIPNQEAPPSQNEQGDEPTLPSDAQDSADTPSQSPSSLDETTELVLTAAKSALPSGLLQGLTNHPGKTQRQAASMGGGDKRKSPSHGRRIGQVAGKPNSGQRLDLLATIRAAAPWQLLRQRERQVAQRTAHAGPIIDIRPSDFRIVRFENRSEAVTLFVVDASGSSALNRLAEAKGAVELLLADCYVRRDQVAMIAFRRRAAELLLPPTRSLTRARRVLAELGGGGATPLASGLTLAREVVAGIRSRGQTALCLVLTDGQANVASNGTTGRDAAEADALRAAAVLGQAGASSLLIDTAVRARPFGARLAQALAARYIVLPNADSASLSRVAREAQANGPR